MRKFSRRNFLKGSAFAAAAVSLNGFKSISVPANLPEIGVQLYSLRKHLEKDFESAVRRISETGFSGVETYALPENVKLDYAARIFRDYKIKVLGMHVELPSGEKRNDALRLSEAYECERIIYAGWPEDEKYKDEETIKRTADMYNEIGRNLNSKGLKFGLHNHWWEFELHGDFYPFYYLLENLDKEIFFEIDTYWAKTAGADPVKIVSDFGVKAPLLHIKDGPAIKGEKSYEQVPAGGGVMNFPEIAKAGGENTRWMIVEFDEYAGDIFDGLRESYDYLAGNKLARGKS